MQEIIVFGMPLPCARPRKGKVGMYDPQSVDKEHFAWNALSSLPAGSVQAFSNEISVEFEYHMPIPASFSNAKRLKHIGKPHRCKPDLSNLIKFTEDALNNIVWRDDSIIYKIIATKIYSDEPKTIIRVYTPEESPI